MTDQTPVTVWQHPGSWSGAEANILRHLNAMAAKIVGNGSPVIIAFVMERSHRGKGDICLSLESPVGGTRSTMVLCHQGGGLFHLLEGNQESVGLVLQVLNQRFPK